MKKIFLILVLCFSLAAANKYTQNPAYQNSLKEINKKHQKGKALRQKNLNCLINKKCKS